MQAPTTRRWLFLDDSEHRHVHFKSILAGNLSSVIIDHVYTAQEAIDKLRAASDGLGADDMRVPPFAYDCAYLDHDLEDVDPSASGQAVAEYIALHQEAASRPKFILIHSWNPEGAKNMAAALKDCGMPVVLKPFAV